MEHELPTQLALARLCDIGIVVKDLNKTAKRLEALGIGPFVPARPPRGAEGLYYRGKPLVSNFRGLVTRLGNVELEVFEPNSKPNPWEEFVETKGEGIHHIGFHIGDVEQEVNRLAARGAEVTLTGTVDGKLAAAYVDLKVANIVFELMSFLDRQQALPVKSTFSKPWDMAVLVKDINKAAQCLEALGIGPFIQGGPPDGAEGLFYRGKPLVSNSRARIMRVGNMQLEIIQPDDKPNPWTEFLNTQGEGIHHIGFQVDDVEQAVSRLTNMGAAVPFFGKINGKVGAAYVDLKIANLFFELTSFTT
jgi:catechol 2,3-dioxygenase-like lactoylglutathione lyase family enzyme